MIDRHYGDLARDGRDHAIKAARGASCAELEPWTLVDARSTSNSGRSTAVTAPVAEQG